MFDELAEELLDLEANVRGFGAAVYAANEEGSSCGTIILSCTCTSLCW